MSNCLQKAEMKYYDNVSVVTAMPAHELFTTNNNGVAVASKSYTVNKAGASKLAFVATSMETGTAGTITISNIELIRNKGVISTIASATLASPSAGSSTYTLVEKSGVLNEVALADTVRFTLAVGSGSANKLKVELVFLPQISE